MRYLPFLLVLALTLYALVDCLQTPAADARRMPKGAWLLLVVLVPLVGAATWLLAGRPARGTPPLRRGGPSPLAPDDDPDFLRQLDRIDREHEDLLQRWEDELRRRDRDPGEDDRPPTS